jgi:hypothetical protein
MHERNIRKTGVCVLLAWLGILLTLDSIALGGTINAASASQDDVQSAIDSASDGDTVIVPASSSTTWTTKSAYIPCVIINKAITVKGQTICTGRASTLSYVDNTIISDGTGTQDGEVPIKISSSGARLTGFTFIDKRASGDTKSAVLTAKNTTGWRIDHCHFNPSPNQTVRAITAFGYGLIDHCYFKDANNGVDIEGGRLEDGSTNPPGYYSWTQPLDAGTSHAIYIEDCEFAYSPGMVMDGAWDAYAGARLVFRYNDVKNTNYGGHGLDSGGLRSVLLAEIYDNTNTNFGGHIYTWIETRGGVYYVFNNIIYPGVSGQGYDSFFDVRYYRSDWSYQCSWGVCDGNNPIDGNTPGWYGWPGMDQPGRGPNQGSFPQYSWNNNFNGHTVVSVSNDFNICGYQDPYYARKYHILENRDFYNEVVNFDGTKGVGAGPFSSRPATCSPNVVYFATDSNTLYQCAQTNTWTAYYKPYIYPHPLNTDVVSNQPPVITSAVSANGTVGQTFSYLIAASGNPTNYNATGLPSGLSVNRLSGLISGTPTTTGTSQVAISAINAFGTGQATLALTINSAIASTNVYYVNNSGTPPGSDSPSYGSLSQPWNTITYALGRIHAGDTLYVKQGTYNENVYVNGPNGTAQNPTVISAYPGDTVTLYGPGVDSGRVKLVGVSNVVFDGFTITHYNQGLFVESCTNVTVRNCTIHHVGQEGLHIHYDAAFITADNCTIHDTRQWMYNGEGIYIGTGDSAPVDNTHDITIRNTTIYNTTDEGIELKIGTYHCIIESNMISNVNTGSDWSANGGSVGAVEINHAVGSVQHYDANPAHIVRNNSIHHVGSAIRAGTGSTIYNNVMWDLGAYGVYVDNQSSDSYTRYIFNNTIATPSTNAIFHAGGTQVVTNNIGPSTAGNIAPNNAFFVSVTPGSENYHLMVGSAPIDAGVSLSSFFTNDKDGVSRPQGAAWDLGAYEYVATTNPPGPSGLVGWWKLDESSGTTAADSSGNGNNGTLSGGTWQASGGHIAGALHLNAFDVVNCGAAASLNTPSVTVAFWMKPDSLGNVIPVDKLPTTGSVGYAVKLRDTGTIWFRVGAEGGPALDVYGGVGIYTNGVWTHVACTFDSGTGAMRMYINGVVESHQPTYAVTLNASSTPFRMGSTVEQYAGLLDDVQVYDHALTSNEIVTVMMGGSSNVPPPVITTGSASSQSGMIQFSWQSVAGASYAVYRTTNLLAGWPAQPLTNNISGDGTMKLFSEAVGPLHAAYYRLKAVGN